MSSNDRRSVRYVRPENHVRVREVGFEEITEEQALEDGFMPPRIADWRNNLTALSQRRNLLFLASYHQIWVWEPAGPLQRLGRRPKMILTPVMKNPHGKAYIDPSNPHAINSVLVDDLGRDEVLLVVTDSGNVCGYRVEAIFSAIERAARDNPKCPVDGSEVKPFFTEYVQESAWGIAIHKYARLIGVSANSGLITVFAFALVDPASKGDSDLSHSLETEDDLQDCDQTWVDIQNDDQLVKLRSDLQDEFRSVNIRLTYTGHYTNIPSISFLNCDLDPNGVWMFSTDINSALFVWNIWDYLTPIMQHQLNDPTVHHDRFNDDIERGWTVIALDPRTLHMREISVDAFGGRPKELDRGRGEDDILDATTWTGLVPDLSLRFETPPSSPSTASTRGIEAIPSFIFERNSVTPPGNDMARTQGALNRDSDGDSYPDSQAASDSPSGIGTTDAEGDTPMPAVSEQSHEDHTEDEEDGGHLLDTLRYGWDEWDDDELNDRNVDTQRHPAYRSFERMSREHLDDDPEWNLDKWCTKDVLLHPVPTPAFYNFPILHFSQTEIRMFFDALSQSPIVVCSDPLRQFVHVDNDEQIFECDRFNMVKYVPELGMVIAASQKGRVAVICLTRVASPLYNLPAFRVDWILPTKSQEEHGLRPFEPLLGISVAPMQGYEIPPDVPFVPRRVVSDDDLSFHYRAVDTDEDSSASSSNSSHGDKDDSKSIHGQKSKQKIVSLSDDDDDEPLTLPEYHAQATRAYRPDESWRARHPSRHYRLMLMYVPLTVLTYEFWYDSKDAKPTPDGFESDRSDFI